MLCKKCDTEKSPEEFAISKAVRGGWSFDRIKNEIDKCEVLCSNCHIEHHHLENIGE